MLFTQNVSGYFLQHIVVTIYS